MAGKLQYSGLNSSERHKFEEICKDIYRKLERLVQMHKAYKDGTSIIKGIFSIGITLASDYAAHVWDHSMISQDLYAIDRLMQDICRQRGYSDWDVSSFHSALVKYMEARGVESEKVTELIPYDNLQSVKGKGY